MRFRSRLLVDLAELGRNIELVRDVYRQQNILFMVKADGYGHGMVPLVRFAAKELGIREFGCATLGEALTLREELADLDFEIYVFSDVQIELKACTELYLHRRIIPVISNYHDLEFILDHSDFRHFPLCLKFNTGMNRLGIDYTDADQVAKRIKRSGRRQVYHAMTHFASAHLDLSQDQLGCNQQARFEQILTTLKDHGLNIERTSRANSGAIEQKAGMHDSHIRPGLLLYGPNSVAKEHRAQLSWWKGNLISQLETYILHVFEVDAGATVGYGASPVDQPGVIAIIALGYGDGFSTRYRGAHLTHRGHVGQVIGRVNMDMAQVLFPLEAKKDLKMMDKFIIWGKDRDSFMGLAEETQMLTYELFCQLSARIPREQAYLAGINS